MGLLSMRERVSLVDGELSIRTAPGDGTAISATVPTVAH
jgi:signal transduction histidine kinase